MTAGGDAAVRRVLFLVDAFWHPHGGTEGQLATLVPRLPPRWKPEVWVVHHSPWFEEHPFPCPTRSLGIKSLKRLRWLGRIGRLARDLRRERFDLVVTFMGDAGVLGPLLAPRAGIPVLVARRDLGFWHTDAVARVQRRTARRATGFLANAAAVARHVVEAEHVPPGAVTVVRNGHEAAPFDVGADAGLRARLSIPEDAPLVVCLANFRPLKRHGDLVAAAGALADRFPRLHLLLLGQGPEDALRAAARAAGVEDRLRILHATDGVAPLLKACAVGALCSETEGLSNAVLECMGAGLPVVVSDAGGNPELVRDGETGFVYPVGDVPALARALERLLDDPERARAMGRAGRARFEAEFGVDRMVGETVAAFDAAVVPPAARTTGAGLAWEAVSDLARLEAATDAWRALVGPLGFFTGPDWVLAWFCHAAPEAEPLVLLARDGGGRLVGVLPLVRAAGGALEVAGARDGADHVDVLAAPGLEDAVAEGALERLCAERWGRLRLRHLREDGALRLALFRAKGRLPSVERLATSCPYVATAGGFEAWLGRFSAKHRGNLRRQVRAFRAEPGAEVVRVSDPAACDDAVVRLFALHAKRAGVTGARTRFAGPRARAFHAALARALAARGDLSLAFLRVAGKDVAAHYGWRSGGRLWHFQGGFDPAEAARSPGSTLLLLVLEEDVFGGGLAEYDFLDGDEAYKAALSSGARRCFDVLARRPTWAGRAVTRWTALGRLGVEAVRAKLSRRPAGA